MGEIPRMRKGIPRTGDGEGRGREEGHPVKRGCLMLLFRTKVRLYKLSNGYGTYIQRI